MTPEEIESAKVNAQGYLDGHWVSGVAIAKDVLALVAEMERVKSEGERQYDYNCECITKIAALEARIRELEAALKQSTSKPQPIVDWPLT